MSRRINIRRTGGGGGGGSGGGGGATYQQILGANLIAMWHSQRGIGLVGGEVDTWTDQINGIVLSAFAAGRRPAYAADGVLFGGKPVVQTALAGNRCLGVGGIANTFIPIGSRPWCFLRSRTITSSTGVTANFGSTADGMYAVTENATNSILQTTFTGTTIGPLKDTTVHSRNYGLDGVNQVYTVDAGTFTLAAAGGIGGPNDMTRVSVGCVAWSTNGLAGNAADSIALYLICAAQPSAAQIAAVNALMTAEFP